MDHIHLILSSRLVSGSGEHTGYIANHSAPDNLDPERLRMALNLAEDAANSATHPMTTEQKTDLVMTFYLRLGAGNPL